MHCRSPSCVVNSGHEESSERHLACECYPLVLVNDRRLHPSQPKQRCDFSACVCAAAGLVIVGVGMGIDGVVVVGNVIIVGVIVEAFNIVEAIVFRLSEEIDFSTDRLNGPLLSMGTMRRIS